MIPTEIPLFAGKSFTAVVTAAQSKKAPPFHATAKSRERSTVGVLRAIDCRVRSHARRYPSEAMAVPMAAVR